MFHCSIPVRVALCCMFSSMEWHSHLYCCCLVFQHQTACPKLITLSPAFDRPGLAHPGSLYSSCPHLEQWLVEHSWTMLETPMYPSFQRSQNRQARFGTGHDRPMAMVWQGCKFPGYHRCIAHLLCCELLWFDYSRYILIRIFWFDCSVATGLAVPLAHGSRSVPFSSGLLQSNLCRSRVL